jgi:flagellar FliJ protein
MSSAELRDYQVFLARLAEAVRQQALVVERAKVERDAQRAQWQQAAQRSKAVEHVIENWRAEDRKIAERKEQRDSDERAQRAAYGRKSELER